MEAPDTHGENIVRTKLIAAYKSVVAQFALPNETVVEYVAFTGDPCPFNSRNKHLERYNLGTALKEAIIALDTDGSRTEKNMRRGGFCFGCGKCYSKTMGEHVAAPQPRHRCDLGWLGADHRAQVVGAQLASVTERAHGATATNLSAAIMAHGAKNHAETTAQGQVTHARLEEITLAIQDLRETFVKNVAAPIAITPIAPIPAPEFQSPIPECTICLQHLLPVHATSQCDGNHKYHTVCHTRWVVACTGTKPISEADLLAGREWCVMCNVHTDFSHTLGQGSNAPVAPQVVVVPVEADPETADDQGVPHGGALPAQLRIGTGLGDAGPVYRDEVAETNQIEADARAARRFQDAIHREDAAALRQVADRVKADEDYARELELDSGQGPPPKRMRTRAREQ